VKLAPGGIKPGKLDLEISRSVLFENQVELSSCSAFLVLNHPALKIDGELNETQHTRAEEAKQRVERARLHQAGHVIPCIFFQQANPHHFVSEGLEVDGVNGRQIGVVAPVKFFSQGIDMPVALLKASVRSREER